MANTNIDPSLLYLPPVAPTKSLTADENLLQHSNLQDAYKEISNNHNEPTFKSYISHLPGNLDEIISLCEQTSANGLKRLALEYQIPPTPANFLQFDDAFLSSALAFDSRAGKKHKSKRRKDETGQPGEENGEKKQKKKKKEKKDKKDKKDKKKEKKEKKEKKAGGITIPAPPPPTVQ